MTADYMVTFTLTDASSEDSLLIARGLKMRYFRPSPEDLPTAKVGDVMLLRHVKVCLEPRAICLEHR